MTYSQRLSTGKPGYLIILIDQSGSMKERFGGIGAQTKAEACSDAVNYVLRELGYACVSGELVKNRCDVSVLSYGGVGGSVQNALPNELSKKDVVKLQELVDNCIEVKQKTIRVPDPETGEIIDYEDDFPI